MKVESHSLIEKSEQPEYVQEYEVNDEDKLIINDELLNSAGMIEKLGGASVYVEE